MTNWAADPAVDEGALEKAKEAIVGDVPLMSQPPDVAVTLLRGLWQNNAWHNKAEVRELTGEDEEIVARALVADDSLGFVDATICQGFERIGGLDLRALPAAERLGIVNQLLIGEKEQVFLRILQVTFGDERTLATTCPACKAELEVIFSIDEDIDIKPLEDPHRVAYEFKLRDGSILEYRLVIGSDQAEATKRRATLVPEQNTILLSRCIVSVNGKMLLDPLHYARSMGAGDRRKLLDEIDSLRPGPFFKEVKLPCAECGVESDFQPGWADLL